MLTVSVPFPQNPVTGSGAPFVREISSIGHTDKTKYNCLPVCKNMMLKSPIIAVVGGLNMDLVFQIERMPIQGESMDSRSLNYLPGGKGANTAVATYRASHDNPKSVEQSANVKAGAVKRSSRSGRAEDVRVFMNGAVGGDDYGAQLKSRLRENFIDTTGVLTDPEAKSGTCVVLVSLFEGDSRNVGQQGANRKYTPREPFRVENLAGKTKEKPDLVITHLGITVDAAKKVLEIAKNSGVDTILNPSPTEFLTDATYDNVTHLILNEQEAAELSNKSVDDFIDPNIRLATVQDFIKKGAKFVILTLASRGAYFATSEGEHGHVPAVPDVEPKDSTGAG
jgi:ribokinase